MCTQQPAPPSRSPEQTHSEQAGVGGGGGGTPSYINMRLIQGHLSSERASHNTGPFLHCSARFFRTPPPLPMMFRTASPPIPSVCAVCVYTTGRRPLRMLHVFVGAAPSSGCVLRSVVLAGAPFMCLFGHIKAMAITQPHSRSRLPPITQR